MRTICQDTTYQSTQESGPYGVAEYLHSSSEDVSAPAPSAPALEQSSFPSPWRSYLSEYDKFR